MPVKIGQGIEGKREKGRGQMLRRERAKGLKDLKRR